MQLFKVRLILQKFADVTPGVTVHLMTHDHLNSIAKMLKVYLKLIKQYWRIEN